MFAPAIASTYLRYASVSIAALAVDMLGFLALLQLGQQAMGASALSYVGGIIAHWLLSSRYVFRTGIAARGPARLRQKGLFIGSALVGLALTTLIVGLGNAAGLSPLLAKCAAVAISFQTTYLLRKTMVFRA